MPKSNFENFLKSEWVEKNRKGLHTKTTKKQMSEGENAKTRKRKCYLHYQVCC